MQTLGLAAGLTAAFAYTFMQIAIKRQGKPLGSLPLMALLGLLLPLWLGILLIGLNSHLLVITITPTYLTLTLAWAVLAAGSMALLVYLIARLPLTPLTAWRKLFTLLLAMGIDLALLHQTFPMPKLAGLALLATGSFMLTPKPSKPTKRKPTLPLAHTLLGAAVLAGVMTLQLAIYQQALHTQTDVLSHVALAKSLMALCGLALLAHTPTRMGAATALNTRAGTITMLAVAGFFVVGSLAEGMALQHGTLTLLVVATLLVPAIFTAHDLWHGDLAPTRRTLLALALTFAGFALTAFSN